jgi:hypothetical protein
LGWTSQQPAQNPLDSIVSTGTSTHPHLKIEAFELDVPASCTEPSRFQSIHWDVPAASSESLYPNKYFMRTHKSLHEDLLDGLDAMDASSEDIIISDDAEQALPYTTEWFDPAPYKFVIDFKMGKPTRGECEISEESVRKFANMMKYVLMSSSVIEEMSSIVVCGPGHQEKNIDGTPIFTDPHFRRFMAGVNFNKKNSYKQALKLFISLHNNFINNPYWTRDHIFTAEMWLWEIYGKRVHWSIRYKLDGQNGKKIYDEINRSYNYLTGKYSKSLEEICHFSHLNLKTACFSITGYNDDSEFDAAIKDVVRKMKNKSVR